MHLAKCQTSLGIHPLWSDQSSLWVANDQKLFQEDSEDWSDLVDAQADLSLCWAHAYLLVLLC